MAKTIRTIDYDSENDIFFISDGSRVRSSLDIGDFVLDVNGDNLISGIEIQDASENLGISKGILKNVKSIKMSVTYKTNNVYVLLVILFKENNKEINIPIPLSLSLGHKNAQQTMLVYN